MGNAPKKNLIYFIYWQPSSEMLLFNLALMDEYIQQFDGVRIIKVAGVDSLNPVVIKRFGWLRDAKFVKNDLEFNERPHFVNSLNEMYSQADKDSITFYAHAKGISRVVSNPLKWWVQLMYKGNLGSEPNLIDFIFSGCFGKLRRGSDQVPVPWHYSGSFYWFRTREVIWNYLQRDSQGQIPSEVWNRWFTENFPALFANQDQVEFKIHASDEMRYNCYREDFWIKNKHLLKLI